MLKSDWIATIVATCSNLCVLVSPDHIRRRDWAGHRLTTYGRGLPNLDRLRVTDLVFSPRDVVKKQWPDFSHLWNSRGDTSIHQPVLSATIVCRPIRLQNLLTAYRMLADYVCVNDVTTIERKMATSSPKQLNPESAIRKASC